MRSKIITDFRQLAGKDFVDGKEGLTGFVLFGRAIVHKKLEKRQIDRCMKRCINLSKYDFSWKEAIEHFYKLSQLVPLKGISK